MAESAMNGGTLAEELQRERAALLRQAAGLDASLLRLRPADEDWSIIEVLAHLIDVDRHWLAQALALRDDPRHVFVPFDDDRWKREHSEVRTAGIATIRQALDASHREVVETVAALAPAELLRAGIHPRGHAYTVAAVFERFPAHDRNHAQQIAAIRERLRA
jgi:uncharacterized damage-inducible protein DinB